jgi:hypothetical protein
MKQNASKPRKFLDNGQTTKLDYFVFEKLNGLAFGITYIETDTMGRNFARIRSHGATTKLYRVKSRPQISRPGFNRTVSGRPLTVSPHDPSPYSSLRNPNSNKNKRSSSAKKKEKCA